MTISVAKAFLENSGISYKLNEPMANHTSFKIGGAADLFVQPKSVDELQTLLRFSKQARRILLYLI